MVENFRIILTYLTANVFAKIGFSNTILHDVPYPKETPQTFPLFIPMDLLL